MAIQLSGTQLGLLSGGPSTLNLSDLYDVLITSAQNNQYLKYNAGILEWQNSYIGPDIYTYLSTNLTSSNGVSLTKLSGPLTVDIALSMSATGDATGTVSNGLLPLTLASVANNVGTFGSASVIPVITVDAKGRVTSVTATPIISNSQTATSLSAGAPGDLPYQTAYDETSFLPIAAENYVLTSTGIGPIWSNSISVSSLSYGAISNSTAMTLITSVTTPDQVLDIFSADTYRSVKYLIQVTSGTSYQMSEINIIHNNISAYITEYGIVLTNTKIATFDTALVGSGVRLLVTPENPVTTIKLIRTIISV